MAELKPIQEKTLKFFAQSTLKNRFYWTGGTALSFFYLHHRQSEDLDFFTDRPFSYNQLIGFVGKLKKTLKLEKVEEDKIYDRWDFFLHNKQKLRIEFVLYEFPKIGRRGKWQGIVIDSLDDIAANKTISLFDRNDPKDLVDLYFLLTQKDYKLKELLNLAEKKFGLTVGESSFWSESLKGLQDINKVKPLLLGNAETKQSTISQIKEYFSSRSADYLHKVLK